MLNKVAFRSASSAANMDELTVSRGASGLAMWIQHKQWTGSIEYWSCIQMIHDLPSYFFAFSNVRAELNVKNIKIRYGWLEVILLKLTWNDYYIFFTVIGHETVEYCCHFSLLFISYFWLCYFTFCERNLIVVDILFMYHFSTDYSSYVYMMNYSNSL